MATINGVSVNFGIEDDSIVEVRGSFQSREHSYRVENESIKNGGDVTISKVYYDPTQYATFTYVATNVDKGAADADVSIPTMGEWIQIFDNKYPDINGFWLVEGITTNSSNTSALRVTLNIAKYGDVEKL